MADKNKVYAYFDGSNFYHLSKKNFGFSDIDFNKLSNSLLKHENEELIKIKYFNSPLNQQEEPEEYAKQLKFFEAIKKTPLLEVHLGRLVKRPLNKINILCKECGLRQVNTLYCPNCGKPVDINRTYKSTEKGTDISIALNLIIDALNNNYETALLFSGDADFAPAMNYLKNFLKKEIIYCRFPKPKTSELLQTASSTRLITKDIMEKSRLEKTIKQKNEKF